MIQPSLRAALITRLKIMAKLDIAERRLPQDGRIKTAVRGVEIDIRVSTIPTNHGESVVMRVLDKSSLMLGLPELGQLFHCNRDFAMVEGFSPSLTLKRTQTIMEGESHCDFRFKRKG